MTFCRLATGPLTDLALVDPSHDTGTRHAAPALRSRSTSTLASTAAAIFRAETSGAFPPARSPSARHLSFPAALARKVHRQISDEHSFLFLAAGFPASPSRRARRTPSRCVCRRMRGRGSSSQRPHPHALGCVSVGWAPEKRATLQPRLSGHGKRRHRPASTRDFATRRIFLSAVRLISVCRFALSVPAVLLTAPPSRRSTRCPRRSSLASTSASPRRGSTTSTSCWAPRTTRWW